MADARLAALILAAGKGRRMGGGPKVLCRLDGRTLLEHAAGTARRAGAARLVCVVGHARAAVAAALPADAEFVEQREQLGTGHAALQAEPLLGDFPGEVLVLYGDKPLVRAASLRRLVGMVRRRRAAAALLTFPPPPGSAYGRIVRDGDGRLLRIVEAREASPAEMELREANGGCYCFRAAELFERLRRLRAGGASGEIYLTDVIGMLVAAGRPVVTWLTDDPDEALGVNDPEDLAAAEAAAARRAVGARAGAASR